MDHLNHKEVFVSLREAGLTRVEIRRMLKWYRGHVASALDQAPPPDMHRLEFVRWLVAHRRLTEQIDQLSNAYEEQRAPQGT